MKKKMILGAAITVASVLAVVGAANRGQITLETAIISSETQKQATIKIKGEPVPEMVTLDEPIEQKIEVEPMIEADEETEISFEPEPENEIIEISDEPENRPEPPKAAPTQPQAPKQGDKKDGRIYINGFGWIENKGGGGEGKYSADMYCNGNKIGTFG